ncbi:hypothetical protein CAUPRSCDRAFT_12506 [Caulochytrium protostelioides]|uniref:IC97/Casc1 N-terminal domain-containing protein n=1 Tax=Caulochytrium protostelioides TaxID=1555241 RepID=A0A4P9WT03_9FUNG|nr:hypothetical protein CAUPRSCDRAFT_12506 [Caulochytrium protostelioides]
MPPKKPEGTKKKKKENERELALARARAEEEARLLEIRLEQEREAQEARDAEILAQKLSKQYEEHELARQERRTAEEMNALALVKQLEAIHEDKMWQHFKNCERLPFVYNWSDINAFCEEWKSSTAVQDALDANDTSLAAFGVQLKDFLAILRTVSDELNMTYLTNQKQTMLQLRDRLQPLQTRFRLMLDQLTYTVGQRPNLFQEPGVENLTFQRALLPPDEFRLAFWVNLTKNPRIPLAVPHRERRRGPGAVDGA